MIAEELRSKGITDEKVLRAMDSVERKGFVPSHLMDIAYQDSALPIGHGQTISQPFVVALMTEQLDVSKKHKVLEIGAGSGYQSAVLAELAGKVYTVEIIKALAARARQNLEKTGYRNVEVRHSDGYLGWEENAPFDRIMITAAVDHVPPLLFDQLKDGGRMVLPLGRMTSFQTLTLVTKKGTERITEHIAGVMFVPMTGRAQEARQKS
ncbi:protein-L-isoaspartate(D-aspartate) O-methyltransferase [Candidatus Woesearchaeota archaeon]|nr:protein-L-isoaspartate(D-aspartate) O-methyltransferase [Candidatus Woesearchaeota archaeon]